MMIIIILSIALYIAFGEISFQWTKSNLIKEDLLKAHITFLIMWPVAWIIGVIRVILDMKADKIAKDIEDMLK